MTELALVNRLTFTHRPTLRWLARQARSLPRGAAFSVLDVGYGDGDLLRAIARWAGRRGLKAELTGIDLNPRSAAAARAATPPGMSIDYRTGDVFSYQPDRPVDFIVSSQVAHHLSDQDIVELLTWLETNSVHGWHLADLHRHSLAYYGFPILAHLMRSHRIIRTDGMISIARGFRREDLQRFLEKADLSAEISWYAFRFCVRRTKAS
ncbi:methyltransferase domain-containing protein [Mycobacterium palustre]|uniref:methyltransferase domain-containing protein n=1 Tax=Mycobacterium palustre TaxID=153971 RepID=UPI001302312C|nr:methyltransferase domain-containing protein [Mycobacterium palustre]MCV7101954.1 methyltransferase domain-containing protein [Mycobacterium palustre]